MFALLISLLGLIFFDVNYLFILFILIGSLFPDVDSVESYLGRKFRILSGPIEFIFGHRGLFHSIYPVLLFLILFFILKVNLFLALSIGYSLHLILDMFTKEGVVLFNIPFRFKIRGFIKTGRLLEGLLFYGLAVVNLILIYNIYF